MAKLAERAEIEEMEGMEMEKEETAVTDIAPLDLKYETIQLTPEVVGKYICKGGTPDDIFWFLGTCRARNLDPLKGEVYFIKFPGEPGRTVVGYRKYLTTAYANGLEDIEYEFDDPADPQVCTITLEIKERQKPFKWETWLEEVIKYRKDGKPNKFWATMKRDMFRKCAIVRALRYSGLDTESLPYIAEETVQQFDSPALQSSHYPELQEATREPAVVEEVTEDTGADLTPLRETYFGMIEGIFANADDRHAWQLLNTGEASVTKWKALEYSRAFKALSQMAGPRKKEGEEVPKVESEAKVPEVEKMKSEPHELVDGMSKEEAEKEVKEQAEAAPEDKLSILRKEFLDQAPRKFSAIHERDVWCRENISEDHPQDWMISDYTKAITLMSGLPDCEAPESVADAKENKDIAALRRWFITLAPFKFRTDAERQEFIDNSVAPADPSSWTGEEYESAIALMEAMPNYTEAEAVEDEAELLEQEIATFLGDHVGNIRADFISISTTKFPTISARDNWLTINVKSPDKSWTDEDYAKAIILLSKLPDFQKVPEDEQKEAQDENKAANSTKPQSGEQSPVSDNLAPIQTKDTYEAIRKLVLVSDKYPNLRSVEFRDMVREVIDHKYGKLRAIREEEGQAIIARLETEAEAELIPDDLLTDEQKDEIEFLVGQMPKRFRMGTEVVRSFITAAIKQTEPSFRYSTIRKLTAEQGDIVIEAQKNFISAEAHKYNGFSKEETATTHVE